MPLNILKETWSSDKRSNLNIISYVLMMRDRLESMATEANKKEEIAKLKQKTWYDKGAREHSLDPGDKVLVLLVVLGDGRDKDNEKVRIPLQDECSFTLKAATEREKSRNIHGYVSVD